MRLFGAHKYCYVPILELYTVYIIRLLLIAYIRIAEIKIDALQLNETLYCCI